MIPRRLLISLLMALSLTPTPATTAPLIVGYGPGGAYDIYARLIAKHMGPTLTVQNMPGAGSLKAANWLYGTKEPAFGIVADTFFIEQLLGNEAVRYDVRKFNYIGRLTKTVNIQMTTGATMKDAMVREVPMGATGVGGNGWAIPTILNKVLGTKFKVITGYPSSVEAMLAMDRGELDGASTLYFLYKTMNKKYTIILQDTLTQDVSGVQTLGSLGTNPDDSEIFRLYASASEIGVVLLAPPSMSADNVEIFRNAFNDMVSEPNFNSEFHKMTGEYPRWATGETVEKTVNIIMDTSPSLINRLKNLLK